MLLIATENRGLALPAPDETGWLDARSGLSSIAPMADCSAVMFAAPVRLGELFVRLLSIISIVLMIKVWFACN